MATIREVALRARVSTATVSHVINESAFVSPRLKQRVLKAIGDLNYSPNALARGLRRQETKLIGMVIPNITNPFFPSVVRGAEDVLHRAGYNLVVGNSDYDLAKEESYYRTFVSKRVDGLILQNTPIEAPAYLYRHNFNETPVVYIDRFYTGMGGDAVLVDNLEGSYDAVSHLIAAGHRRMGIITGPLNLLMAGRRLKGYEKALREAGLTVEPELIREGRFDVQSGYDGAKALLALPSPPTAIFACNGLMAMGCVRAFREAGARCPEQVALVSFDDLEWFDLMQPAISTVAQPVYEMGASAARLLLQRIADPLPHPPRHKILKTRLVVRDSSKSPIAGAPSLSQESLEPAANR